MSGTDWLTLQEMMNCLLVDHQCRLLKREEEESYVLLLFGVLTEFNKICRRYQLLLLHKERKAVGVEAIFLFNVEHSC